MPIARISPEELFRRREAGENFVLLDVREDDEVAFAAIPGSRHIVMSQIPIRHNELPDDVPVVIYCHHGVRSMQVARFLEEAGFDNLANLEGGIDAWSQTVSPDTPRY